METPVRLLGSHYRLGELLGRGAMGEVYVAHDVETQERLAAKVLRAEHTDDDEVTARFLQERKLLRELTHPNIVRVRELVVDREQIAIVMDLIEGEDLRKRLRREGTLAPAEAVRICADVLAALSMAHSLQPPVQHRDVKPDNVLLGTGSPAPVFLTDFGVSRLAEVGTSVRLTSGIGTADYMAPEMTGTVAGAPADVYAVGITLYELLCGHTPFGRDSFQAIAMRHVTCLPPTIPGLPAELWANLESMLVKSPDSRPTAATAEARLRALLPALAGLPALPATETPTQWQQISGATTGSPAALDGPSTMLKGTPAVRSAAEMPQAGLDSPLAVRRDGLLEDSSATAIGSAEALQRDRAAAAAPVVVGTRAAEPNRRPLLIAAAAVVAVAVVAGIAVIALHGRGSSTSASGGTPAGSTDQVALAPGADWRAAMAPLTITRTPTYDLGAKRLSVALKLTDTGSQALGGSFFEAIPDSDGTGCAVPTWSGGTAERELDATDPSACGWKITPSDALTPDSPATVTYSLPMTVAGAAADGDGQAKLQTAVTTYLGKVADATDAALQSIGATDTSYAAQRLSGISVRIKGRAVAGRPLPVVVDAQWASGEDNVHPLYAAGQASPILRQLGMALSFGAGPRGCDDLKAGSTTGGVPSAPVVSAMSTCDLSATLGDHPAVASGPVSVAAGAFG